MHQYNFLPSIEMKIHTSKDQFITMLKGEEKEDVDENDP